MSKDLRYTSKNTYYKSTDMVGEDGKPIRLTKSFKDLCDIRELATKLFALGKLPAENCWEDALRFIELREHKAYEYAVKHSETQHDG